MHSSEPVESFLGGLFRTYADEGGRQYGTDPVSQLEHALQCAGLAEADGASDELIVAGLLHDFGHLIHGLGRDAAERGINDRHEFRALHVLHRHYGEGVLSPIRLHVEAKRYLCAAKPGYRETLSEASRLSLELQGGAYTADEARSFIRRPFARDAVRLRIWDDRAKLPGKATRSLQHYGKLLQRCAL